MLFSGNSLTESKKSLKPGITPSGHLFGRFINEAVQTCAASQICVRGFSVEVEGEEIQGCAPKIISLKEFINHVITQILYIP